MLVLSRKKGESIVLAESIVVTVLKVDRGTVRLGISAPADVRVFREEVVQRPRRAAAGRVPVPAGS